jgi:hypothetical protein
MAQQELREGSQALLAHPLAPPWRGDALHVPSASSSWGEGEQRSSSCSSLGLPHVSHSVQALAGGVGGAHKAMVQEGDVH